MNDPRTDAVVELQNVLVKTMYLWSKERNFEPIIGAVAAGVFYHNFLEHCHDPRPVKTLVAMIRALTGPIDSNEADAFLNKEEAVLGEPNEVHT